MTVVENVNEPRNEVIQHQLPETPGKGRGASHFARFSFDHFAKPEPKHKEL